MILNVVVDCQYMQFLSICLIKQTYAIVDVDVGFVYGLKVVVALNIMDEFMDVELLVAMVSVLGRLKQLEQNESQVTRKVPIKYDAHHAKASSSTSPRDYNWVKEVSYDNIRCASVPGM